MTLEQLSGAKRETGSGPKKILLLWGEGEESGKAAEEMLSSGIPCGCMPFQDYEEAFPQYMGKPVLKDRDSGRIVAFGLEAIQKFIKNQVNILKV